MYRIARRDLEILIGVTLTTLPRPVKSRIRERQGWNYEAEFIRLVCDKLDNPSTCVVSSDRVATGGYGRPGRFGEDEPAPPEYHPFRKPWHLPAAPAPAGIEGELPALSDEALVARWSTVDWPSAEADILTAEMERRQL
ncbi:hypothetical protein [Sphingomonas sanxanigenens]|uniref:Uncharacterized protein n=1 Tax=Sphingomonas sanxanigenens DSM 19645 = NX02 TaxID=1123269 RepID=W0AI96_9SPHN|nr:hypothetical protein [Sphingomonas sanxanigenens]AHE55988.1 hypothetical protein NX02_21790 [Sphingomonas sanxanigenens DSM 19645 = NX02]